MKKFEPLFPNICENTQGVFTSIFDTEQESTVKKIENDSYNVIFRDGTTISVECDTAAKAFESILEAKRDKIIKISRI